MSEVLKDILIAIGPALTTGLLAIVLFKVQSNENRQKSREDKTNDLLIKIEAATNRLTAHDETVTELKQVTSQLCENENANRQGIKMLIRYMLRRYHGEYMFRGYITSHEKQEFLELYDVYHAMGGNGTGTGWMNEVCELPVRDDLGAVNPYLEILQMKKDVTKSKAKSKTQRTKQDSPEE